MGKKHAAQQLVLEDLEEHQKPEPTATIRIDAHQDMNGEDDMGSLPGCIGLYNQPEPGFVCRTCYHQQLCKKTSTAPTVADTEDNRTK